MPGAGCGNAVERAVTLTPSPVVELEDLGLQFAGMTSAQEEREDAPADSVRSRVIPPALGEDVSIEEIEREHIARVVARAPSFEIAARILGIDPTTLQRKRKRYGLV